VREKLVLLLVGAGVATGIWLFIGLTATGSLRDQLQGALERANRAAELGAGAISDLAEAGREIESAQDILAARDLEVAVLRDDLRGLQDELGSLRNELVQSTGAADDLDRTLVASDDQASRAASLLEAATRISETLAISCDME
jgi:chromosome segregation ATPase